LKRHRYGQWNQYSAPTECGAEIFSLDEDDYRKSVALQLHEVDDFLLMITDPRSGVGAA